jgi:hypothetical protein
MRARTETIRVPPREIQGHQPRTTDSRSPTAKIRKSSAGFRKRAQ